jgi:hypothetical protein
MPRAARATEIGGNTRTLEVTMNRQLTRLAIAVAAALAGASALAAHAEQRVYRIESDYAHRVAPVPEWNLAAGDALCRLNVWVDDRARIRLHGDRIEVETDSGKRSYDQGSACTQPLPEHAVDNFRVVVEHGRGTVMEVRSPESRNGYKGSVSVDDPQDGGDTYQLVMAWHNPGAIVGAVPPPVIVGSTAAPVLADNAPLGDYTYVDEVRACQDKVRAEFLQRNRDGDAYITFDGTPSTEHIVGLSRSHIHGDAWARNRTEDRRIRYRCTLDNQEQRVLSASYDLRGPRVSSLQ